METIQYHHNSLVTSYLKNKEEQLLSSLIMFKMSSLYTLEKWVETKIKDWNFTANCGFV